MRVEFGLVLVAILRKLLRKEKSSKCSKNQWSKKALQRGRKESLELIIWAVRSRSKKAKQILVPCLSSRVCFYSARSFRENCPSKGAKFRKRIEHFVSSVKGCPCGHGREGNPVSGTAQRSAQREEELLMVLCLVKTTHGTEVHKHTAKNI